MQEIATPNPEIPILLHLNRFQAAPVPQIVKKDGLMFEASDEEKPQCPSWCRLAHQQAPVLVHEGETYRLMMTRPREGEVEFLKVRTVEYLPLDIPDGIDAWGPMVEVEHHAGDRYRVLNLTGENARDLAILLLSAAARSEEAAPSEQSASTADQARRPAGDGKDYARRLLRSANALSACADAGSCGCSARFVRSCPTRLETTSSQSSNTS